MTLSITSDYVTGEGCPKPYLEAIADTGFSHVHWCHQWCTDFIYCTAEIDAIKSWFDAYGLTVCDVHASHGVEKAWASLREYERLAGVELVKNRIDFAHALGSDVIILHRPEFPETEAGYAQVWEALRQSLDALEPYARQRAVRIAIENMPGEDFEQLRTLFSLYAPDYLGLCYDAGHGNIGAPGLSHLETVKERLLAVHLHDNDGQSDQHKPLFSGTVDWERLAKIMATSSYTKPVSMEVSVRNASIQEEGAFLAHVFETGTRFSNMIAKASRTE